MDGDDDNLLRLQLWYQRWQPAHQLFWRNQSVAAPSRTHRCDVLVIGAGPAGLTAAWLLQRLGYDVRVVEHEPTVGGAARTEAWKDALIPCGALYFAELSPVLREVLQATGLQPVPIADDALWLKGKAYRTFWRDDVLSELPIPQTERHAFRRFRTQLQELPIPPYPLPNPLPPRWQAIAAQPAEQFVSAYGSSTLTKLLNAYARSAMGASLAEVSTYCLWDFYSGEFGREFGCPRYSFLGGLAALCQRMARQIGAERIWRQCTAVHCEHLSSGRVRTLCAAEDGSTFAVEAAAVVAATPKFVAKHYLPELPPAQQQAMLRLRYAPYLTVHLQTPFRLVPEQTFSLWVPEARYFTDIVDVTPLQPQPVEGFISCIYAPLPMGQRSALLDEQQLRQTVEGIVQEALQLLAPERASAVREAACFVWGHALVVPTPLSLLGAAQQASQSVGRIVFANTDNDASPALENAMEHALYAAETVHRLLRPHLSRSVIRQPNASYLCTNGHHAHPVQPVD
ncbi:MAG: FAD-dependent oxidoreductase [Chlorobiota bacterium]